MFRAMLAPLNSPADTPTFFEDIVFPQLVSPKIDGIRALVRPVELKEFLSLEETNTIDVQNVVLSRNLERLRSNQVQKWFSNMLWCDGELAYNPTASDCLNVTQSYVRSRDKFCETLKYYVFDYCEDAAAELPYFERQLKLEEVVTRMKNPHVEIIPQIHVDTVEELLAIEANFLEQGYEGVMFRNPIGHYKHNRSTYRENLIYKLKRFKDAEAVIVECIEGKENLNTLETDARGYAKRSTNKEFMIGNGRLGKFRVRDPKTGEEFLVAAGVLKIPEREYVLRHAEKFIGKTITYRYFDYGIKDERRFARFIAFRESWDMS